MNSQARLRVLMTTDTVGGVFTYTVNLVRALHAESVEIDVAIVGPGPDADQREQLRTAGAASVHELGHRLEWMDGALADLPYLETALLELEQQLRPDLVHGNSFFCGAVGFTAPVVVVGHSCVYTWWNAVNRSGPPSQWEPYRTLVNRGIAASDALVTPTHSMLTALGEYYRVRATQTRVIPNGTPLQAGEASKKSFVLAAGRMWDPAKNLQALTEAAGAVSGVVMIAGDTGRFSNGDGCGRVKMLGRLPGGKLARLRREAAVFAGPARYEPFGLSILEAAADQCALVLGDIASLRENWDGCAIFTEPEDHQGLALALNSLLWHPERATALGHRAWMRAQELSIGTSAHNYALLYRDLVQARELSAA